MIKCVTFLGQILIVCGLTCDEILQLPESKKLTLHELQTVPPKDTVHCVAHLGKEQLPKAEAEYIWQSIVTFYGGVANIPDQVLMTLHWITPALKEEDYMNLFLSNIDVVQNFGLNYGLDETQLSQIADRVRKSFSSKEPEDYTYYDLIALKQILCAFNQNEIERIHPSAYKEAAFTIGQLENCKAEVMRGFAALAVHPKAFGPPLSWTAPIVQDLGKVAQYMPSNVLSHIHIQFQKEI